MWINLVSLFYTNCIVLLVYNRESPTRIKVTRYWRVSLKDIKQKQAKKNISKTHSLIVKVLIHQSRETPRTSESLALEGKSERLVDEEERNIVLLQLSSTISRFLRLHRRRLPLSSCPGSKGTAPPVNRIAHTELLRRRHHNSHGATSSHPPPPNQS
jgi:hypothetical protein